MASLRIPTLAACCAAFLLALGACSSGEDTSAGDGTASNPNSSSDDDTGAPRSSGDVSPASPGGDEPAGDDAGADAGGDDQPGGDGPESGDPATDDPGGDDPGGDTADDQPAGGAVEPDVAMPEPVGDEAVDRMVAFIREQEIDRSQLNWRKSLPKPPELEFPAGQAYDWVLHTNLGDMRFRLRPQGTPMHVSNAIYLTKLGYYDGLGFHRVIEGFMAQGGCPDGTGSGGPGYQFDGEFPDGVKHARRGDLSTANSGEGTDGSQFFICFAPQPGLDGRHTVWGGLVEGFDTLEKMMDLAVPNEPGTPEEPITIESAEIVVR